MVGAPTAGRPTPGIGIQSTRSTTRWQYTRLSRETLGSAAKRKAQACTHRLYHTNSPAHIRTSTHGEERGKLYVGRIKIMREDREGHRCCTRKSCLFVDLPIVASEMKNNVDVLRYCLYDPLISTIWPTLRQKTISDHPSTKLHKQTMNSFVLRKITKQYDNEPARAKKASTQIQAHYVTPRHPTHAGQG